MKGRHIEARHALYVRISQSQVEVDPINNEASYDYTHRFDCNCARERFSIIQRMSDVFYAQT